MMKRERAAVTAVALTMALGACSTLDRALHPDRADVRPQASRQVPAFDGHEIWVDYACEGAGPLRVRFNGAWADATLPDGVMVRLARTDPGTSRPDFANGPYRLNGPGLSPTWTTPAGAAQCTGSLA